jgi:hypothetical protein
MPEIKFLGFRNLSVGPKMALDLVRGFKGRLVVFIDLTAYFHSEATMVDLARVAQLKNLEDLGPEFKMRMC